MNDPDRFDRIVSGVAGEYGEHLKNCSYCSSFVRSYKMMNGALTTIPSRVNDLEVDHVSNARMIAAECFENSPKLSSGSKPGLLEWLLETFKLNPVFAGAAVLVVLALALFSLYAWREPKDDGRKTALNNNVGKPDDRKNISAETVAKTVQLGPVPVARIIGFFGVVKIFDEKSESRIVSFSSGDSCEIAENTIIQTAGNGGACRIASKFTQCDIKEDSRIKFGRLSAFLEKGESSFVFGASEKLPPGGFRIDTPHVLVTVTGTRLNLKVSAEKTILSVTEGKVKYRVKCQANPSESYISRGQSIEAGPGGIIESDDGAAGDVKKENKPESTFENALSGRDAAVKKEDKTAQVSVGNPPAPEKNKVIFPEEHLWLETVRTGDPDLYRQLMLMTPQMRHDLYMKNKKVFEDGASGN